jgi:accessory gene regulator protein AgrB
LDTLEIHDQENAKLVEQIAEQLQDLTNGVEVVAARVRLLLVVLVVTLALGVIGFFAVLR